MASAADNRRGIIYTLAAMLLFVCNDVLMKLAREVFPAGQAIAIRTGFAVIVGLVMVYALRDGDKLLMGLRPILLLRGLIESGVALTFIWSLGLLPLANITAIVLATPIILVVMAVALRIETVGWRRTLAILVGFAGVLLVVRPSAEGFSPAAIVALISAVLVAARDLTTRRIHATIPTTVISLTTTVIVGLVAAAFGAFEVWQPIWRLETIYLAAAAVLVASGSFFIVGSFRNTDVGVVAGYRYAVVIFALIAGYLVWGDVPDAISFAGIGLIVGAGLYTMHRQRVRPDSKLKPTPGPAL